jgi:protein TonB
VPRFTSKGSTFQGQMTMLAVGVGLSLLVFLALPFTQKISSTGIKHQFFQSMDMAKPPPPPPPNEPPPKQEEQRPEEKPELQREQPQLTLSQLEAALNPGFGGAAVGDFSLNLSAMAAEDLSRIFELTEIDRVPQPIVQVAPVYPFALSRAGITGRVEILFVVTPNGTVRDPRVVYSSRVEFEKPALDAVLRWRFEPGIKSGTRVAVRMQLPFTFNVSD